MSRDHIIVDVLIDLKFARTDLGVNAEIESRNKP